MQFLVYATPHVLKHPRMLVPQSSTVRLTEAICTAWHEIHLMLQGRANTLLQSSNAPSPNAFTIWCSAVPRAKRAPKNS